MILRDGLRSLRDYYENDEIQGKRIFWNISAIKTERKTVRAFYCGFSND